GPADDVFVSAARRGAAVSGDGRRPAVGDVARVPRLRVPARRRADDVEAARPGPQLTRQWINRATITVSSSAMAIAPTNSVASSHGGTARAGRAAAAP